MTARFVRVLAAVVVTFAAMAAVPAGAATETPKRGGSITMLTSTEILNFDPVRLPSTAPLTSGYSYTDVYDFLVRFNPQTGKFIPRLAESFTPNAEGTVWTMKLRPGLKFTDGTALDAAAVKFNWDRLKDPAGGSACQPLFANLGTYEVTGPLTIRITGTLPRGQLPTVFQQGCATTIASPAAIQKFGSSYGTSPESVVGAGPFKIKDWFRGDHLTLTRNTTYWDKPRPYLDELTLKPLGDPTQSVNALIAGNAQAVVLSSTTAENKRAVDAGFEGTGYPYDGGQGVLFNVQRAPLNDERVRRALVAATDLTDATQKATSGAAPIVDTYFLKGSPYYNAKVEQHTNDLKAAQKLVDQYVAEKGGPIKATFLLTSSLTAWGAPLQQQWSRLKNVEITLDVQPATATITRLNTKNFDMAIFQLIGNVGEDMYNRLGSKGAQNFGGVNDPVLDKSLDEARAAVQVADRKKAFDAVTQRFYDQAYGLLLFRVGADSLILGKSVKGGNDLQDLTQYWVSSK